MVLLVGTWRCCKLIRGGVEDTRLEAKDTKKFEAKDSPSEDRPLEAKDRNARSQGHRRKCSPKKQGLQENFLGVFQKLRSSKNISGELQKFNGSKNSAVLEPRTEQFSRLRGQGRLTSRPRTFTFEAKAKDFKMCPRGRSQGQERPQGLHL